jgi:tetratricopeptide (TPR) repeat protein
MRLEGVSRLVPTETGSSSPRQVIEHVPALEPSAPIERSLDALILDPQTAPAPMPQLQAPAKSVFTPQEKDRLQCSIALRRMWLPMLCNNARTYSHNVALRLSTDPHRQFDEELLVIGRDQDRIELLKKSPKWEAKDREVQTELRDCLAKAHQDPRDRGELSDALKKAPNDIGLRFARATCILKEEKAGNTVSTQSFKVCLADLELVLSFVPTYEAAQFGKATCLDHLGKYAPAIRLMKAILQHRPAADLYVKLSQIYRRNGELELSFDALREAIQLDPSHYQANYTYAKETIGSSQFAECGAHLAYVSDCSSSGEEVVRRAIINNAHLCVRSREAIKLLAQASESANAARQRCSLKVDKQEHRLLYRQELILLYELTARRLNDGTRGYAQNARQLAWEGLKRDHGVTRDETKAQRESEKLPK